MSYCPRPGCPHPLVRGFGCVAHGEPSTALPAAHVAALSRERAKRRAAVHWSAEHWRYAESLKGEMSGPEIAAAVSARFGHARSWKSIKHQFERRGVSKPPVRSAGRTSRRAQPATRRPRSHWSAPELEALEDGEVTILVRARSRWAVVSQAKRLGVPVRSGDGMMSIRQVEAQWRVRHATLLRWARLGLIPATRNGDLWRIEPEIAERIVPLLRDMARANAGRRAWWQEDGPMRAIAAAVAEVRQLDRIVDDLVRPDLVRSE